MDNLLIAANTLQEFEKVAHRKSGYVSRRNCIWVHSYLQVLRRKPGLIVFTESANRIHRFKTIVDLCVKRGYSIIDMAGCGSSVNL